MARLTEWATKTSESVVRVQAEVGSGVNGARSRVRRLLADPQVSTVVVEHRDRLGRISTELVEAALAAHGRRLVVGDDGEVDDDLVRDMVEVLTGFCARLYGGRSVRNRALKALGCAQRDIGTEGCHRVRSEWSVMSRHLRRIADPFVVAAPSGARVRTRLHVAVDDEFVLRVVGEHLGRLAGGDLSWRCSLGDVRGADRQRAERKRVLTGQSSSRWAGAITRTSNDQWDRARRNGFDERAGLRRAIKAIESRVAAPVGGRNGRVRGYPTRVERWHKQQRLQHLQSRRAALDADIAQGRVSVCRGGRRFLNTRHNLGEAGHTEQRWRQRWRAERLFLTADGEADKLWGNETIRVHPDEGWCELKLPVPLGHLANRPHGRYRLSCPVEFAYRGDEWVAQAATGAVRNDISFDAERDRWYLDASWSLQRGEPDGLDELGRHRSLAVDLNADHLACWVIDPAGNPAGPPHTITVDLAGAAATRDGRLRTAISDLITIAKTAGCRSISIENLGFDDARHTGRETMGRGKRGRRFRATVAAIPTAQFRARLAGMAHNRGLAVVAVDPAYTSRWGAQHWQQPLNQQTSPDVTVTRHHAAAVVIGRRSHGYRARRHPGVPRPPHQRMGPGELPGRAPHPNRATARNPGTRQAHRRHHSVRKTGSADRDPPGNQATQHRSGPPVTATSAHADKR